MIPSLSNVYEFVLGVQDTKKIFAISLIPYIGTFWSLFKQIDVMYSDGLPSSNRELFGRVQEKNRMKLIAAAGALTQVVAYTAYHVFHNSLSTAFKNSSFLSMTLMFTAVHLITAGYNRWKYPSANAIPGSGVRVY